MIEAHLQKRLDTPEGEILLDLELKLQKGQMITIYGPSGAGKTSILRMISGLMKPDGGYLKYGDTFWYEHKKQNIPARKRRLGYLFQDYALFPNMTIEGNIQFALEDKKDANSVSEILDLTGLNGLRNSKIQTLSGGQKQRVALARAIVSKPELLLLDEPLSALDGKTRYELQKYILKIQKEFNISTILVTHDISEILRLSDYVYSIDNGRIINQGKPQELFTGEKVSGKFQFTGEVLKMEPQDFLFIVHVLVGKDVIKVVMDRQAEELKIGDKVLVASKAFNPIISKISN